MAGLDDGTPAPAPQGGTAALPDPRMKDAAGAKWNALTAIRFARRENKKTFWLFGCECGSEKEIDISSVKSGNTKSCGCLKSRDRMGLPRLSGDRQPAMEDLAGQRFTHALAESEAPRDGRGLRMWNCLCDCGSRFVAGHAGLKAGKTRSCGCLQRIVAKRNVQKAQAAWRRHGKTYSPEWICWQAMLARCRNPKSNGYHRYGGRGITVCERWSEFEAFLADMGEKPSPAHSIGRTDNDKGYFPGNCKWETATEQARNRRGMRMVTWRGETLCLSAWAERTGLGLSCLWTRLRAGWPLDLAFTEEAAYGPRPWSPRVSSPPS